eukprot:scaffold69054_cov19-Cyclotella_meneghiniana.AAC.1
MYIGRQDEKKKHLKFPVPRSRQRKRMSDEPLWAFSILGDLWRQEVTAELKFGHAAETIDYFYTLSWSFGGSAMVDVDGTAVNKGRRRGKSGRVHGAALTGAFLSPQKSQGPVDDPLESQ